MWRDRFSGQSTPAESSPPPQGRSYSPNPRRPTHLTSHLRQTHNGPATRSSTSLDLSANTSTASLPTQTRLPNGSSLRYEQRAEPEGPDPLDVLRSILGLPLAKSSKTQDSAPEIEKTVPNTELASQIDFDSHSLTDYLDQNTDHARQRTSELQSTDTQQERKKYEEFQQSITECDDVLASVERYLTKFQVDLGQVAAEIEDLQNRSLQINAKLENRRNIEKLLGPAVEELSLSPLTVRAICEGPVDEYFMQALKDIEARSNILETKLAEAEPVKAVEDLRPLINDLKAKALERIRDFVVAQIKALRSPNVNAQVLQQQTFLKYKDLYSFLVRNHALLGQEIGQAYVNTMKWYYSSNFTRYIQALGKLQIHELDQHDILGADTKTPSRNVLAAAKPPPPPHDAFNIGRRADLLKTDNSSALPSHATEDTKNYHYLETPFRNFNLALIDNVTFEYSVSSSLFSATGYHETSRKVTEIFTPTFALGHTLTKKLIETTTDCLGVLLCVRLSQSFAFELQRRKIPVADSYVNYTNILLWPRFQQIMDLHCESLRKLAASISTAGSGSGLRGTTSAAFALVGGGSAANDSAKSSLAPHPVSQRFGQFVHGILTLSADAGDDEPVANSLSRLRTEYEGLMGRLARGGDGNRRNKFLYNNYSLVLTIVGDCVGKLAEEVKEHFKVLLGEVKGR